MMLAEADSKSRRTRRLPRDPLISCSAPTARRGTATCKDEVGEVPLPLLLVAPRPQTFSAGGMGNYKYQEKKDANKLCDSQVFRRLE